MVKCGRIITVSIPEWKMYLYLVRHGEARRVEEDPSQGLSERGLNDIRKMASFLADRVHVVRIHHSGKTRTMQTAQVFAGKLYPSEGISPADGLLPMDDPAIWAERLTDINEDTMLVGHLPYMSRLTSLLLCRDPERARFLFEAGSVVCLERSATGEWSMAGMIPPDLLPQPDAFNNR